MSTPTWERVLARQYATILAVSGRAQTLESASVAALPFAKRAHALAREAGLVLRSAWRTLGHDEEVLFRMAAEEIAMLKDSGEAKPKRHLLGSPSDYRTTSLYALAKTALHWAQQHLSQAEIWKDGPLTNGEGTGSFPIHSTSVLVDWVE